MLEKRTSTSILGFSPLDSFLPVDSIAGTAHPTSQEAWQDTVPERELQQPHCWHLLHLQQAEAGEVLT
jgi:hypothetical protein